MGNAYKVGKYKLTAMQSSCYEYLKTNKGQKSIDNIIKGVYNFSHGGPDLLSTEENLNNVTKWCNTLAHLKLINSEIKTEGVKYWYGKLKTK